MCVPFRAWVQMFDKDGSGSIDLDEFAWVLVRAEQPLQQQRELSVVKLLASRARSFLCQVVVVCVPKLCWSP